MLVVEITGSNTLFFSRNKTLSEYFDELHSKLCLEYPQLNIYDYLIGLRATYKNEVKITSCRLTSQKNKRIFCAQNSIDGKRNNVVPRKKVNVLI